MRSGRDAYPGIGLIEVHIWAARYFINNVCRFFFPKLLLEYFSKKFWLNDMDHEAIIALKKSAERGVSLKKMAMEANPALR
jgi:hypothetical protein